LEHNTNDPDCEHPTDSPEQAKLLRDTLERCNAACNAISQHAFDAGVTRRYHLHKLIYVDTQTFELTAQAVVRRIAKMADARKTQRPTDERESSDSGKHATQPYDDRIFRLIGDNMVSIRTVVGRMKITFVCSKRQRALLASRKGEVDLMLVRGKRHLAVVCDVPDPEKIGVEDVRGIDLGVVNLADDSDGRPYSGADVERVRQKFSVRRAALQCHGGKRAKRGLKKLSGKEAGFRKHVNHCISKQIAAKAERSGSAIASEDLTHIRKHVKARRAQRNRLHGWCFGQLRQLVSNKVTFKGIPIVATDPRNTSRTGPESGSIHKANRKSQQTFSCVDCGHTAAAGLLVPGISGHLGPRL
jgi:putative transposase